MRAPLPIDEYLPQVGDHLARGRALVIVAPPGAGKTTRVAPTLVGDGPVILLQPRRVAARALARRIAEEQGFEVGQEVGWQVRFEREFTEKTRLLVATEGILNARLLADPLLSGFRTVIVDEFHERSIHADLALAFLKQALLARDDLRVVVMSATLDAARVSAFLDGCPVLEVPGRPYPVDVRYAPGVPPAVAVREAAASPGGHILCFLPGVAEIRAVEGALAGTGLEVRPLYGALDARAQELALLPSPHRKAILATNIAETSLTVDGVDTVVDSGWHKVQRYDAERGIDRLERERIPADSAEQRAGRAGRTAPGRAVRLWDARDRLRPHREPDILRIDLAGPLLDVIAWGGDPLAFEWFEAPPSERLRSALDLLGLLGAVDGRRITALGQTIRRLALPPRLARVLVAAGPSPRAAAACALLSEPRGAMAQAGASPSTDSDVLALVDRLGDAPGPVRQVARELLRSAERLPGDTPVAADDAALRRALLEGYPDRVARRREPGSLRLVLASGHGAVLGRESGVRDGDLLVALDVVAGPSGPGSEALVRVASRIEREWLEPTSREVVHRFDAEAGAVRAVEREWYMKVMLAERPVAPRVEEAAKLLATALRQWLSGEAGDAMRRRLAFAGLAPDLGPRIEAAVVGQTRLPDVEPESLLTFEERRDLDRLAPLALSVPSGRQVALQYGDDGQVVAAVKLQELFGLAETPRLGPRKEPVTLALLAPNGRAVQTTRDLRSFWDRTYPEVRKELRGRYPRHPWPEDPWTAMPTHRTKKKIR
ncbi:MAG: ATP-dependent helicase HrpB [Solirubrobacterales bacterium]|jgi:ATP-dependent helicase HrpB